VQAVELDVATLSPALDPDRLASLSTEELDLLIGLAEKGFLTLEQVSDQGQCKKWRGSANAPRPDTDGICRVARTLRLG
jgi:hypothetical protein